MPEKNTVARMIEAEFAQHQLNDQEIMILVILASSRSGIAQQKHLVSVVKKLLNIRRQKMKDGSLKIGVYQRLKKLEKLGLVQELVEAPESNAEDDYDDEDSPRFRRKRKVVGRPSSFFRIPVKAFIYTFYALRRRLNQTDVFDLESFTFYYELISSLSNRTMTGEIAAHRERDIKIIISRDRQFTMDDWKSYIKSITSPDEIIKERLMLLNTPLEYIKVSPERDYPELEVDVANRYASTMNQNVSLYSNAYSTFLKDE